MVAARKKAAKARFARKPLRGCESPRAEPGRELNGPSHYGARLVDTVEGVEDLRKSNADRQVGRTGESVETL
jgi:hypothetical protein